MEVTYRVQRRDLWRGSIYSNTHHPQLLIYLLYVLFMFLLTVTLPLLQGEILAAFWAGLRFALIILLTTFVVTAFGVYKRMPSENTERFCTERIGPYGFECLVPEGHRYAGWQDVLKMTETAQDFFVFAKKGKSYIIPKRIFDSPEQAQTFFATADRYWKDARAGRVVTVPPDETVWPPAPRIGKTEELDGKRQR